MTQTLNSSGHSPITSAVSWLETTLLGTFATTVAVIAVATVGFLMLTGRIDVRRAVQVVLGCFVIFGASTIAAGILPAISGAGSGAPVTDMDPPSYYPPTAPAIPQSVPAATDPYAGAAVPKR